MQPFGQYGVCFGGSSLVYFFVFLHFGHLAVTVITRLLICFSYCDLRNDSIACSSVGWRDDMPPSLCRFHIAILNVLKAFG